jgi:hypothetical protein
MEQLVVSTGHVADDYARVCAELDAANAEIARLKSHRPAVADDLLMWFGRIAGVTILSSVCIVLLLVVIRPEADIAGLTKMLDTQLSIILGAVLGYAARSPDRRSE